MKQITIHMTWKNSVTVEVDDDFEMPDCLNEVSEDVLEQMDSLGVSLTDWEVL